MFCQSEKVFFNSMSDWYRDCYKNRVKNIWYSIQKVIYSGMRQTPPEHS